MVPFFYFSIVPVNGHGDAAKLVTRLQRYTCRQLNNFNFRLSLSFSFLYYFSFFYKTADTKLFCNILFFLLFFPYISLTKNKKPIILLYGLKTNLVLWTHLCYCYFSPYSPHPVFEFSLVEFVTKKRK